jgi:cell division control protein 6
MEHTMDPKKLIEETISRVSVFKRKEVLYPEYIPPSLPHRENQIKQLAEYFKQIITSPGSSSIKVLAVGGVGTGKTVTTRVFGREFREFALRRGIDLRYVHINCHRNRTLYEVVTEIIRILNAPIPLRGFSPRELTQFLHEYLDKFNIYLIVALDEFDYFIETSGSENAYFLLRLYDEFPNWSKRINYILISRDYYIVNRLDSATYGYVVRNIVKFSPYKSSELKDILTERRDEAFHKGTVSDEVISYIADLEGHDHGGSGNARASIETLLLAGEAADQENSPVVKIDHVRKARALVTPDVIVISEALQNLTIHELLLLKAIIEVLSKTGAPYISIGEAENEYRRITSEYSKEPRRHTQIYEYIMNMKRMGIIETRPSGKGRRGRTTMIGIGAAPLESLKKRVDELINKIVSEE